MGAPALDPGLIRDCVAFRRAVHSDPELSGQEYRTRDRVAADLRSAGFELREFPGSAALSARWPGGDRSRAVAFRADLDALPMEETSGLPWAAKGGKAMHACGHDGHTAILLGFAKHLARAGKPYATDVLCLFQPAEEAGNGAKQMALAGALDNPKVEAVFGLHGWPELPFGSIGVHSGAVMASVDNFEIKVSGRGGHGAQPHLTRDPVFAAAQLVTAAQSLVSRNIDPLDTAVVTFAHIQAGRAYNVIPEECLLRGTVRAHAPAVRTRLREGLETLATNLCRGLGLESDLRWVEGCPALRNDAAMSALARRAAIRAFGAEAVLEPRPSMAAEDFPFLLEKAPGAYLWLGLGDKQGGLHNPRFDFNDDAIEIGIRLFLEILKEMQSPA